MSWLLALFCLGCSEPAEPILRGYKHEAAQVSSTSNAPVASTEQAASREPKQSENPVLEAVDRHAQAAKLPLNLTLPQDLQVPHNYNPRSGALPNLFKVESDQGISLSGRLYWEEAETAEETPFLDSINGAGLEIRISTP